MTDSLNAADVIVPFQRAAGIAFGTSRAAVRARLGVPAYRYRVPQWEDQLSDSYDEAGLLFGYDDAGNVLQIHFTRPANPVIGGFALLDGGSESVHKAIVELGLEVRPAWSEWEVPAWGVTLAAEDDHEDLGDEPFGSVTAYAHGPVPEPDFFHGEPAESATGLEVDSHGFGQVRIGGRRDDIRALLGQGMAVTRPGRDLIESYLDVAVTYDRDGIAIRVSAMADGVTAAGTSVGVGWEYGDCVAALRDAGVAFEEGEAEIRLTGSGIRLLTAQAGDAAQPVTSVVVTRPPR